MFRIRKLDHHSALMGRMAEAVGAPLAEAVAEGRLSPPDLRTALLACTGCASPGACEDWLDSHPAGADAAPAFCRNRDLFERLREA